MKQYVRCLWGGVVSCLLLALTISAAGGSVTLRSNRERYVVGERIYLQAQAPDGMDCAWEWEWSLPGGDGVISVPGAQQSGLSFPAALEHNGRRIRAVARLPDGSSAPSPFVTLWVEAACRQLRLVRQPDKTEYLVGEPLDPGGARICAVFSDGEEAEVTQQCTWMPERLEDVGTCQVTAACTLMGAEGTPRVFTVSCTVEVRQPSAAQPVILTQPRDAGETGSPRLQVRASAPDGGNLRYQWYGGWTPEPADMTPLEGAIYADYTPTGAEDDRYYAVAVYNQKDGAESAALFSRAARVPGRSMADQLELQALPHKRKYAWGEALDLTGLKLTVLHSDGSREPVDAGYFCPQGVLDQAGSQVITVFYRAASVSFLVEVGPPPQEAPLLPDGEGASPPAAPENEDPPQGDRPAAELTDTPGTSEVPSVRPDWGDGSGKWKPALALAVITAGLGGGAVWALGRKGRTRKPRLPAQTGASAQSRESTQTEEPETGEKSHKNRTGT